MSAMEFKLTCAYSGCSAAIYFIIQAIFKFNPLYSGVFPQLWYNMETTILFLVTYRSVLMFRKFEAKMQKGSVAQVNLHYYALLNMGMAAALFWDSFFGFGFNADIFTEARVINRNVFLQDFFIRMFTITHVLEYIFIIGVMFPPSGAKQNAYKKEKDSSKQGGSKRESQPRTLAAGRKARQSQQSGNRASSVASGTEVNSPVGKDSVVQINSVRAPSTQGVPEVETA
jgi:hypothetical protein